MSLAARRSLARRRRCALPDSVWPLNGNLFRWQPVPYSGTYTHERWFLVPVASRGKNAAASAGSGSAAAGDDLPAARRGAGWFFLLGAVAQARTGEDVATLS